MAQPQQRSEHNGLLREFQKSENAALGQKMPFVGGQIGWCCRMDEVEKKILVIDDENAQRTLIRERLERMNFTVTALDSAEEALYHLETTKYPVIITDLKMPWMDGVQFCNKVRKIHPQSLIFLLSGYVDSYDQKKLKAIGFDGIFRKPLKPGMLEEVLEAVFQRADGPQGGRKDAD